MLFSNTTGDDTSSPITRKVRDKRWQNFGPLPVIALLFFFSAVLIGLTSGELFLGFSIFPLIILLISSLTFLHTLLDTLLYLTGHLQPIYTLSMSVIMTIFWLISIGLGAADIAVARNNYCTATSNKAYFRRLGCYAPRARLGVEILVLVLYVVLTGMAALAHERYCASRLEEVYSLRCCHRLPGSGGVGAGVQVQVQVGEEEDEIRPAIPPRAARRASVCGGEKLPVFAEMREEGYGRVLSVRNI